MKEIKRRSDDPVSFALDFFGDRWTLLIVRDLIFRGKRFYGEFLESDERIATNILADRLAMLEREGFATKTRDPGHGSRKIYRLTEKGVSLLPILLEIINWSAIHDSGTDVDQELLRRVRHDKENLIREITDGFTSQLARVS